MLYHFLKFWFVPINRGWFRKMYLIHDAPIPKDVPVIYASTHPNSVIDYLPAPYSSDGPVNVLVRGDVFENKTLNKFFRIIWMLPVYRIRDGYSSLAKNDQSFKSCYESFDRKEQLLVFSEGICVQEKALQPIKKGTARLALDYLFKHGGEEIYIIPMASNYTHYRKFRASMTTFFGVALKCSEYKELYDVNPNKAYEKLTADITSSIQKNFIEVKGYKDDCLTEKALEALRLGYFDSRKNFSPVDRSTFDREAKLVNILNEKGDQILSDEFKSLSKKLDLHHTHEGVLTAKHGSDVYLMQTIVLTPIMFGIGLIHVIPYLMVQWVLNKKIKDKIFHDTITVFGSGTFYLLQTIILAIIGLSFFGLNGLLIPAASVALTHIGLNLLDEYLFGLYHWKNLKHKSDFQRLFDEVNRLIE